MIGWSVLASITGAVIVSGWVASASRNQVVEHIDEGTVSEVLVRDSDVVAADEVLLRFDDALSRSEEAILMAQYAELVALRNRLEAEFRAALLQRIRGAAIGPGWWEAGPLMARHAPHHGTPVDWPALLPDVARRLLGRAGAYRGRRRHVALRHPWQPRRACRRRPAWHLARLRGGRKRGTLALVEHLAQTDWPGALRWLTDAGLIAPRNGAPGPGRRPPQPAPAPAPPPEPKPSRTAPLAAAILAAAQPADETPARAYLARRWTWPPFGIGPALPPTVAYLPAAAVADLPAWQTRDGKARRLVLPAAAAGAVVYAAGAPNVTPTAAGIEAVTADGA